MNMQKVDASQRSDQHDEQATAEAVTEQEQAGQDAEQEEEELSLDVVFEILRNERRRYVLEYLQSHENPANLGDLAEHIAALENDTTVNALTAQQRKRVYVGLYQCHLPKMDDVGVVNFDQNRGTIEMGESAFQMEDYLGTADDEEPDWPTYYLGISLGSAVLFALAQIQSVAWATDLVMGLFLVAVVACAVVHRRSMTDEDE